MVFLIRACINMIRSVLQGHISVVSSTVHENPTPPGPARPQLELDPPIIPIASTYGLSAGGQRSSSRPIKTVESLEGERDAVGT